MSRKTLRRGVRRASALGAAACFALALSPSSADAQSGDEGPVLPEVFSGSASASAASVQFDRAGTSVTPVPDLFHFVVADGTGTYSASEQRARASLVFPGNGATQGPALACSQVPADALPIFPPLLAACFGYSFPLTVTADPLEPDASTEGSVAMGAPTDPFSIRGVGGRAHAGIDAVTSTSAVGDLRLLGAPAIGALPAAPGLEDLDPYLLRIGAATADTDQRIDEAGALVVDSVSALSDIGLVGGLVHIGSLRSHARVVEGEADPVTEATMEVSGVTVAGLPARLTERGLEIGEAATPVGPTLDALGDQLESLLESLSFRITSLPIEQGVDDDGLTNARVSGLMIEFGSPVEGLPAVPGPLGDMDFNGEYVGSIVLGSAGARGIATSIDSSATPSPVVRPPIVGGGAVTSPGGSTGGGSVTPAPSSGAPPAGAPSVQAPPDEEDPSIGLVADVFAQRLELLYLAFTLAGLAICLAPRLSLPARLPGVVDG